MKEMLNLKRSLYHAEDIDFKLLTDNVKGYYYINLQVNGKVVKIDKVSTNLMNVVFIDFSRYGPNMRGDFLQLQALFNRATQHAVEFKMMRWFFREVQRVTNPFLTEQESLNNSNRPLLAYDDACLIKLRKIVIEFKERVYEEYEKTWVQIDKLKNSLNNDGIKKRNSFWFLSKSNREEHARNKLEFAFTKKLRRVKGLLTDGQCLVYFNVDTEDGIEESYLSDEGRLEESMTDFYYRETLHKMKLDSFLASIQAKLKTYCIHYNHDYRFYHNGSELTKKPGYIVYIKIELAVSLFINIDRDLKQLSKDFHSEAEFNNLLEFQNF